MYLKKHLGQHILTADPTAEKIVRTLSLTKDDTVLEIGPGTGKLTKYLAKAAGYVIAVEKDPAMIAELRPRLCSGHGLRTADCKNIEIIHADFLKLDLTSTLQHFCTSRLLFCGNLPYNISTPILFKLKENRRLFSRGVIILQKEAAERLTAKPGSKDYGILSIMMQVSARMEKSFDVSARSFFPPPKVTSTVIKMEFTNPPPYIIRDDGIFTKIVRSAFGARRKMIRNSISREYLPALEAAGISPERRPETISIAEFIKIADGIIS